MTFTGTQFFLFLYFKWVILIITYVQLYSFIIKKKQIHIYLPRLPLPIFHTELWQKTGDSVLWNHYSLLAITSRYHSWVHGTVAIFVRSLTLRACIWLGAGIRPRYVSRLWSCNGVIYVKILSRVCIECLGMDGIPSITYDLNRNLSTNKLILI